MFPELKADNGEWRRFKAVCVCGLCGVCGGARVCFVAQQVSTRSEAEVESFVVTGTINTKIITIKVSMFPVNLATQSIHEGDSVIKSQNEGKKKSRKTSTKNIQSRLAHR